jgi:hypothetical protein
VVPFLQLTTQRTADPTEGCFHIVTSFYGEGETKFPGKVAQMSFSKNIARWKNWRRPSCNSTKDFQAAMVRERKEMQAAVAQLNEGVPKMTAQLEASKPAPQTVLNSQ